MLCLGPPCRPGERGRLERERAYIGKKRALIGAREPRDGSIKRQPVDSSHIIHQVVGRLATRLHSPVVNDLGASAGLIDQRSKKFMLGTSCPVSSMTSRSAAARGVSPSSSLPLGSTHSLRLRKRTTAISGVPSRRSTIPPAARTGARTISRPMSAIFETRSDRQYSGARLKVEIATHLLANETIRGPDAALTLPRLIFR